MKKFLVLVLALIMCLGCFASCTIEPQDPSDSNNGNTPTLAEATEYLNTLYKNDTKEHTGDYELIGKVKIGSTEFPVTWAVDTDLITIKASTKTQGFWTADLPAKNETAVNYKLTATIKDAAGNTATKTFDRTIGVYDNSTVVTDPLENVAYKLFLNQNSTRKVLYATAELQDNKFIIGSTDPAKGLDFYAEQVEGGYKFYTTINDAKMYLHAHTEEADDGNVSKFIAYAAESDNVWYYKADVNAWFVMLNGSEYVLGTYNAYNTFCMSDASFMTPASTGTSQFPANFITKENAESKGIVDNSKNFDDGQVVTLEQFNTIADACEDKGAASAEKYIIEGVITEVANTTYGNLYIENEAGTKVYVYGLYDTDGNRYDKMSYKPQVGDTVKLYGSAGKYNTLQMPNAILISITKGEGNQGTEPTPPAGELTAVTAPAADVAYKLFLNQVTTGKLLYATAELQNNKFIVGTETATEGLDFFAEVVTGGYKFYTTIDDAKVYLHAHTETGSDGKTSKFLTYETSSDLVWYYKAETNAWFVTINGSEYVLGTYGEYNTFSMSEAKYITAENTGVTQFPGAFATKEDAESLGGSTDGDQGGNTPTPPAGAITNIADALTAAAGAEVVLTGTVDEIYYEWDDSYGNMSVWIKDDADNRILAFRMTTKVEIGDNITVTGTITVYNSTNQIAQGCTAVINGGDQGGDTPTPPAGVTSIADIKAAENGDFTAAGVVVGVNAQSFLLKDETDVILVYFGYSWTPDVAIGDKLTVTGTTSEYAGAKQFTNKPALATYTKNGTETVTQPTPVELTAAEIDAYATMTSIAPLYVKVVGTLTTSGNYYNLAIEGATAITGSITYPIDTAALNELANQTVEVVGYITGVSGSSTKYLNLMAISVNGENAGGDQGGDTPTPPADTITNIADALAAADGTNVIVTGTVIEADTWSTLYNNMSVTIQDENGNQLYVYRLGTQVYVGDVITVTGTMATYNTNRQIGAGATAEIVTAHTCSYADATCTAPKTCTSCGATDGDALNHTEPNAEGKCDRCGLDLSVSYSEETIAPAGSTGVVVEKTISWEGDHFTVTNDQAGSSSANRTTDSDHFRCYQSSELTIAAKNGEKIATIVITAQSASYAEALVTSAVTAGYTAVADGSVVTITVDGATSTTWAATKQYRITEIVVTYTEE